MEITQRTAREAVIVALGGEVDMSIVSAASGMPHLQSSKARGVAVLGNQRIASLPNIPTSKEAGQDNFIAMYWAGIVFPAGTPREMVNRVNAEWAKCAAMPDTKEQIRTAGLEPHTTTPEQFGEFIKAEIARWGKVVKDANIPHLD